MGSLLRTIDIFLFLISNTISMTKGKKYHPSPVNVAYRNSDDWSSVGNLNGPQSAGQSYTTHKMLGPDRDVAAASDQDHLLFMALLIGLFTTVLYFLGLI